MPIPTPMPDGGARTEGRNRDLRWLWLTLFGVAVVAVLGFVLGIQSFRREHDRHLITSKVRDLARLIRAHDVIRIWVYVEGRDPLAPGSPTSEARHQAMLSDFERLGHLEEFMITAIRVDLEGDEAWVWYGIRGVAKRGEPAPPASGEMRFQRDSSGWRLTDHRLIEVR